MVNTCHSLHLKVCFVARQVFESDGHSRFSVHASGTSTRGLYTSNGANSTSISMEDDVRGNGVRDSMDDVGITAQACYKISFRRLETSEMTKACRPKLHRNCLAECVLVWRCLELGIQHISLTCEHRMANSGKCQGGTANSWTWIRN